MAKRKGRLKQVKQIMFILCICLVLTTSIMASSLSIVNDVRIASKVEFNADCLDDLGNSKNDGDVWVSSGGCDRNRCFHIKQEKWNIRHRCREITENENPDATNCQPVANTSLTYPGCCPELSCATASPLTTIASAACSDNASPFSCSVWYNLTDGCQPGIFSTNENIYNLTTVYCRKLCGYICSLWHRVLVPAAPKLPNR